MRRNLGLRVFSSDSISLSSVTVSFTPGGETSCILKFIFILIGRNSSSAIIRGALTFSGNFLPSSYLSFNYSSFYPDHSTHSLHTYEVLWLLETPAIFCRFLYICVLPSTHKDGASYLPRLRHCHMDILDKETAAIEFCYIQ